MLLEHSIWKIFHDIIIEAARTFVPYFEVLQDGFVKRPYDDDLVLCSWKLDVRMGTCEKTETDFLIKCW